MKNKVYIYFFIRCYCFFRQKTAYVLRISDWSSDVCSSDLRLDKHAQEGCRGKLGRQAIDAGDHQLRGVVHFDIEEASSAFIAQFRDIDVEVANLIFLELLRLLPIDRKSTRLNSSH